MDMMIMLGASVPHVLFHIGNIVAGFKYASLASWVHWMDTYEDIDVVAITTVGFGSRHDLRLEIVPLRCYLDRRETTKPGE